MLSVVTCFLQLIYIIMLIINNNNVSILFVINLRFILIYMIIVVDQLQSVTSGK